MSTWVCSISFLTILFALLHIWAEQTTIILTPTKIQITVSNNVNPILKVSSWNCISNRFNTAQNGRTNVTTAVELLS